MVRGAVSLVAAVAVAAAASAASAQSQRVRVNLPAGPLGQSAALLGRQAHVSLGVTDPALAKIQAPAVAGLLSVSEALRYLLRGTGARVDVVGYDTYLITAAAKRRPPPPKRSASRTGRAVQSQRPDLGEIVVTVTKRATALGAYPGAVTIVTEEDLDRAKGLRGSDALVATQPIVSSTYLGPGRNKLFLRGIADSSFSGPTQATVAQYLGEARINFTAPDPDLQLYDIQQVELLPGPQATLYGAGSLGGVIRIVPNPPQLNAASARLSFGGSQTFHGGTGWDGAGMLNIPLVHDQLSARVVAYRSDEAGYIDDVRRKLVDVNPVHIGGVRASARATLSDDWTVDLIAVAQRIRGDDAQYSTIPDQPLTTASSVRQNYSNAYSLVGASAHHDFSRARLVVSGAASRQNVRERYDATSDKLPMAFDQETGVTLHSLEVRALSAEPSPIDWLAGVAFAENSYVQTRAFGSPAAPQPLPWLHNKQVEMAAFGEISKPLIWGSSVTGGLRLARTRLTGGPVTGAIARSGNARTESFVLPSVAVSGSPAAHLLLYGRYQQGFRPGGFAIFGQIVQRFRSDRMASFEAGARYNNGASRLLSAQVSLAYTKWDDIQADTLDLSGLPATINIGNGRIYNTTIQARWQVSDAFSLEAAALLNRSQVTNPFPGIIIVFRSPLPNVARANARIASTYSLRLGPKTELELKAAGRYVGRSRLGAGPFLGRDQGGWFEADLGADVAWRSRHLTLGVTNLFGAVSNRFAFGSPFTLMFGDQITPLRPRTVRLGFDTVF